MSRTQLEYDRLWKTGVMQITREDAITEITNQLRKLSDFDLEKMIDQTLKTSGKAFDFRMVTCYDHANPSFFNYKEDWESSANFKNRKKGE